MGQRIGCSPVSKRLPLCLRCACVLEHTERRTARALAGPAAEAGGRRAGGVPHEQRRKEQEEEEEEGARTDGRGCSADGPIGTREERSAASEPAGSEPIGCEAAEVSDSVGGEKERGAEQQNGGESARRRRREAAEEEEEEEEEEGGG
ncbi:hypothetical protein FQA47_022232 [Oryzias melastigma]|uniref:Uncharacterized protein n=1 Tax=Oryzias melastigma TaxID=30732 RepID=A0A834FIT7_ORYME|nr:hypothetical protein FQA47_022232 [Oryzias melastigma]